MKTEKSIEQIALEKYAEKNLDERYESIGFIIGVVVGVLSAVSFAWSVIHCENCMHDYGMIAYFVFIIAAIMGMFTMGTFILFSSTSRRNEKKIIKVISLLSNEEKRKITGDYIQDKLTSQQNNITSWKEEIQELQNEISELEESIQKSNQYIPILQEKLKNL